ncbi:hypothetical protein ECZU29_37060 [Escherichia coli]|nr:hypothetical protein ECZU29_37060 [Escherichia coli]
MRSAQVYRWQIPMDAGVVLRDRRLKPATGCTFACVRASAKGGDLPTAGLQPETGRGAKRAACR